jgi:hypothetical protein
MRFSSSLHKALKRSDSKIFLLQEEEQRASDLMLDSIHAIQSNDYYSYSNNRLYFLPEGEVILFILLNSHIHAKVKITCPLLAKILSL